MTPQTQPTRLLCPWNSPGKNITVGSHSLLQGIFMTKGSNSCLLQCKRILYHLSHMGSPNMTMQKYKGRQEKGMTEDEMVGWHHRLNGREFEQAPEDGEGQGSLEHCSLWGHKQSDTTERLNNNNKKSKMYLFFTPYSVISKRITDSNVN